MSKGFNAVAQRLGLRPQITFNDLEKAVDAMDKEKVAMNDQMQELSVNRRNFPAIYDVLGRVERINQIALETCKSFSLSFDDAVTLAGYMRLADNTTDKIQDLCLEIHDQAKEEYSAESADLGMITGSCQNAKDMAAQCDAGLNERIDALVKATKREDIPDVIVWVKVQEWESESPDFAELLLPPMERKYNRETRSVKIGDTPRGQDHS